MSSASAIVLAALMAWAVCTWVKCAVLASELYIEPWLLRRRRRKMPSLTTTGRMSDEDAERMRRFQRTMREAGLSVDELRGLGDG